MRVKKYDVEGLESCVGVIVYTCVCDWQVVVVVDGGVESDMAM